VEKWRLEPARDLGMPMGSRLRSLRRESGLGEAIVQRIWYSLVRLYMGIGHRLSIAGREHLPRAAPFVVVANHASHLDALVLAAGLPRRLWDHVFPIAAGDTFFETPLATAFAAELLNALPMWRHNCGLHAMRELRERLLAEPCGYILFPEGTRTRDGRMADFKPGLGMIVAETGVPVIPAYIDGAFEALPPGRRLPRLARIRIRIGPPLDLAGLGNNRKGWQEIATRSEAAVRALGS
jgi:1-acyl-sn-glycerol-3-phosphate acyltransferase